MTATTTAAASQAHRQNKGQCSTCLPQHDLSFHDEFLSTWYSLCWFR
jgi:hypothetical protein